MIAINESAEPLALDVLPVRIAAGTLKATRAGHVLSLVRGRWVRLKPYKDRAGYLVVKLRHDGRRRGYNVARIVLAFFKGIAADQDADHRNRRRDDNRLANLRPLPVHVSRGRRDPTEEEAAQMSALDYFDVLAQRQSEFIPWC